MTKKTPEEMVSRITDATRASADTFGFAAIGRTVIDLLMEGRNVERTAIISLIEARAASADKAIDRAGYKQAISLLLRAEKHPK